MPLLGPVSDYRHALDTLGLGPDVVAHDVSRLRALLPERAPSPTRNPG
jgi:hypothetical protein